MKDTPFFDLMLDLSGMPLAGDALGGGFPGVEQFSHQDRLAGLGEPSGGLLAEILAMPCLDGAMRSAAGLDLGVTNLAAAARKTTRRLLWARRPSYTGS